MKMTKELVAHGKIVDREILIYINPFWSPVMLHVVVPVELTNPLVTEFDRHVAEALAVSHAGL
jgi:hypothetical protein